MIMKPVEDIYPKWDNDKIYTDLDNMIKDILNGQLNEKFWDAVPTTKCQKRKNGVAASVVPNQRPSTMRRKDKEPADGSEASDMAAAHNVAISGLAELVKILTAKMEGIDDSVADKVTKALDATIDSKVEARVRAYESDLRNQIAKLEAQINVSKNNADVNIAPDVTTSKAYEDEEDGACSNDLKKINSQDGLPVDCVVKKEKKDKKTTDSTQNLTTEVTFWRPRKNGKQLRGWPRERPVCFVDAAWDATTRNCGIAGVFKGRETAQLTGFKEPRRAVDLALTRKVVMEAYTANAESLVVLSDSQLLIGLLQTKSSRKELNNILTDIHHFSNRLSACSFIHISRLCNVGANLEAKSALLSVNSSPPTGG
uniref:RNase H type-1 domain-containing protein n=1 Tax=Brassica campestris TaxID=3711 RepID=M4EC13_BRACM